MKYNIEPTSMNLILNKTLNIDDVLVKYSKTLQPVLRVKGLILYPIIKKLVR